MKREEQVSEPVLDQKAEYLSTSLALHTAYQCLF